MAGPIYTYNAGNPSPTKFPAYFNNRYFFFDWTTDWVASASFNADGTVKDHKFFLPLHTFVKPMDMKFGPDGSLYVLAYGNGWGANNDDTGLYRVDYAAANRTPAIKASADKDSGGAPLTVNFDATRLDRSRPGDTLSYAWDFTSDGTTDATTAKATPHLHDGRRGHRAPDRDRRQRRLARCRTSRSWSATRRPVVKIVSPVDGTPLEIGQPVNYQVSVTDAEDGSAVDCTKVALTRLARAQLARAPGRDRQPGRGLQGHGDARPHRRPHRQPVHLHGARGAYTDAGNGAAPALTGYDIGEYSPHTQATNVYPLGEGAGLYTGQTFMQGPGHWFMFRNYDLSEGRRDHDEHQLARLAAARWRSAPTRRPAR